MHDTAMLIGEEFSKLVNANGHGKGKVCVDIGSQDVNGSLRSFFEPSMKYIGVDFQEGKNVDVILDDPYKLPFDSESVDVIVCSSVLEHSPMFWVVFEEMCRILKDGGYIYINVPSNGAVHRYPHDCWRFYPDAGEGLELWAKRAGYEVELMDSFIYGQLNDVWNDFIAIFGKKSSHISLQNSLSSIGCNDVRHIPARFGGKQAELTQDGNALNEYRKFKSLNFITTSIISFLNFAYKTKSKLLGVKE